MDSNPYDLLKVNKFSSKEDILNHFEELYKHHDPNHRPKDSSTEKKRHRSICDSLVEARDRLVQAAETGVPFEENSVSDTFSGKPTKMKRKADPDSLLEITYWHGGVFDASSERWFVPYNKSTAATRMSKKVIVTIPANYETITSEASDLWSSMSNGTETLDPAKYTWLWVPENKVADCSFNGKTNPWRFADKSNSIGPDFEWKSSGKITVLFRDVVSDFTLIKLCLSFLIDFLSFVM